MATKTQIKIIHALKNKLGWSDEKYRDFLRSQTSGFCESSKEIEDNTLDRIIYIMRREARGKRQEARGEGQEARGERQEARGEGREARGKYVELGERDGMATPRQLRMIEAMWKEVSYIKDEKLRLKALNKFIKKIAGVDNIRFLTIRDVRKVIKAIETMRQKK